MIHEIFMRWEVSINRPRSSSILNAEPILFKVVTLTKIIKCQLLSRFNKVFLKAWAHARKSPTELACLYHIRPKTLAPAFVEQMSAQEIPNQNLDFKGTVKWFYYTVCSKKVNPCKFCASSYWWWVCKYVVNQHHDDHCNILIHVFFILLSLSFKLHQTDTRISLQSNWKHQSNH